MRPPRNPLPRKPVPQNYAQYRPDTYNEVFSTTARLREVLEECGAKFYTPPVPKHCLIHGIADCENCKLRKR